MHGCKHDVFECRPCTIKIYSSSMQGCRVSQILCYDLILVLGVKEIWPRGSAVLLHGEWASRYELPQNTQKAATGTKV